MAFLMIAILAIVAVWVTASASRQFAQQVEKQRGRSIDQDMVEARLYRIEEAIDAMAQQIERLTDQQQAFLPLPREPGDLPPSERRE
ncbi:MAG TPA: hypothetical protein VF981_03510 [Gemmatimonadaceae bacterium]